jgi:hypothetical protein
MADSSVDITAGTGTPIHTFTVDGKNRQVTVIGDSAVTGGIAAVTAANGLLVDVSRVTGNVTVVDGGGTLSIDDGGGSITVDGTVALGAGSASIGILGANSGVDIGDVTINNASGASAVNIQDGGNSLTVDGTVAATQSGTWNVGTVTTVTTVSAVTAISNALPAGNNNIGDVDVLSVIPGTGATNLGKAIDSAAGSTDTGVAPLAIRDDSLSALTPAEGDWVPLRVNSTGALHVTGAGGGTQYVADTAHTTGDTGTMLLVVRRDANTSLVGTDGDYAPLQVDANGALKVAGAGTGGTSITDGAAFTADSTAVNPIAGYRDDTSPATVTEGDAAGVRITEYRALHVNLRDALGAELTVGGATQYAEDAAHASGDQLTMAGAVRRDTAASSAGTDGDNATLNVSATGRLWASATIDAALPAGTNNIGDVDILTIAAGDNNIGNVDIVTMPNVTLAAGTNTNEVVGDAAHDAAVAGNPVLIGIEARSTDGTAVTSGDASRVLGTLLGKQVTYPYALPGSTWNYAAAAGGLVNTTGVSAKAAAGAGVRNYVTGCQVINSHQTTGTEVLIRDGAAGTVLHRGWAQPAGGGFACDFNPPLRGTANTLIEIAEVTTTATAGVLVNLQGFTAAE